MTGGLWREALQSMRDDRLAVTCAAILAMLALAAVLGPQVLEYRVDEIDWAHMAVPPLEAPGHWLGTDRLGRDLLVRTLHGLRVSLAIALAATLVALVIGVAWGAFAGYRRGRTDALMMRFVDVLYSLPQVFFVIMLTVVVGRGPRWRASCAARRLPCASAISLRPPSSAELRRDASWRATSCRISWGR